MKTTALIIGLAFSVTSPQPVAAAIRAEATQVWNTAAVRHPADWYAGDEARRLAAMVIRHQSVHGGWPKNTDLFAAPHSNADPGLADTIDNNATTLPLTFLARTVSAGEAASRPAFDRGLDYLLDAQYPNGGWPQFKPLRGGYHDHVTFNDDAMVNVLKLLQGVARGAPPYGFVDAERKARAAEAVRRGVDLILRAQVRQGGVPTAWCAQHDTDTLAPAWARRFEPPSLSGSESVGIVRFLMSLPDPSPEVIAAVDGAVAWLEKVAIRDMTEVVATDAQGRPDRVLAPRPGARIWARFYELETDRPIYIGRDSVIRYDLNQIEAERRNGYRYVGEWAETLLDHDYPAWRQSLNQTRSR